jgi:ferritin-like metal-binding protein YciE
MKHPQSFSDILTAEIAELHSAEIQLGLALPTMIQIATSYELALVIEEYLRAIEVNASRLDEVQKVLVYNPCHKFSDSTTLLIAECEDKYGIPQHAVRDASLIAGLQKINYLKLAIYENTHESSRLLGLPKVHSILSELLAKELGFKKKLYLLALRHKRPAGMLPQSTNSLDELASKSA